MLLVMPMASLDALVGLGLRRAGGCLRQRPDDGPARQIDLEVVMAEALGIAQDMIGDRPEGGLLRRLAAQHVFRRGVAPRLMGDAAEGYPRLRNLAAVEPQSGSHRHQ